MIVSVLGAIIISIAFAIGDQFIKDMDLKYGALGGLGAIVAIVAAIAGGFLLIF